MQHRMDALDDIARAWSWLPLRRRVHRP
jgi:hypothetical protein